MYGIADNKWARLTGDHSSSRDDITLIFFLSSNKGSEKADVLSFAKSIMFENQLRVD